MNGYTVFTLAFGPGMFWLWYFYKKDKLEPEPKSLVLRMFLLGMITVIPAFFLELGLNYFLIVFSPALLMVIVAPIIEEGFKYWTVRKYVFDHIEFDEPMDGIVYAAAVALGFASLENLGYIGSTYLKMVEQPEITSGLIVKVSVTRAIFSVPGHVLFSIMWGYALGASKFIPDPVKGQLFIRRGLYLSMILHGLFNSVINFPLALSCLMVFMLIVWKMVRQRIAIALKNSPYAHPSQIPTEFME